MKKYLAISILLSSFAFSTDVELYTSAVIKLIKENRKMNSQIKTNKRNIAVLEQEKISSSNKIPEIHFEKETEKDKEYISKLDTFILSNK